MIAKNTTKIETTPPVHPNNIFLVIISISLPNDVSIVASHDACLGASIRAIVDADNKVDITAETIRFSLKPHKVFMFNAETEERIYFGSQMPTPSYEETFQVGVEKILDAEEVVEEEEN